MKIKDSVLLSLLMRDNEKYNISQAPSIGLKAVFNFQYSMYWSH